MKTVAFHCYRLALIVILVCCSAALSFAGGQPKIIDSSSAETIEDDGDNWNSHIDNQAYLKDYENRRRRIEERNTPPIVIIKKETYVPYGRRNCDSETVYVQSGGSTLIYADGYRTNCYPHHVIVPVRRPVRPTPYIRSQNGQRVWSTGQ
jgi:hypothetical protein